MPTMKTGSRKLELRKFGTENLQGWLRVLIPKITPPYADTDVVETR